MSCRCVRRALYAAKCANIPADIFSTITCSKHSNPTGADKSTDQNRVTLAICPDSAVIESDNVASWPVVYHGTAVELIQSVLKHCMILKIGDVLFDGNQILRRNTAADSTVSAVWTYPQPEGAKTAARVGVYDGGETQFQMIIRLRQKQGTYTVHPKGGYGFDVWSTERRGTLIIEALEVYVSKSKGAIKPFPPMRPPKSTFVTSFKCPVQQRAFNAIKLLKLPTEIFDMTHNRCYCESCYPKTWPDSLDYAGENYVIPRGWVRFGLLVNPVFAKMNKMWESWHSAYHGCHPRNVISIFRTRMLLIPHDVLPDGRKLTVCSSADRNQQYYFLSPEIGYSAHPWYAKPVPFIDADGKRKYFQTVLMFKVRPGSFQKKNETEGGEMKMFDDYSLVAEDEIEWYSNRRGCTHPYGLLFRIVDASNLDELNKYFDLGVGSAFRQTREFSLDKDQ